MQYSENNQVLSGLQADSRRDNGDRISLIDYALEQVRKINLLDGKILELQGYYRKTIDRNTAYHGVFCKQFNKLPNNLALCVIGAQDCQYPLEYWLTYENNLIFRLATFKNTIKGLEELQLFDLLSELTLGINIFDSIVKQGIRLYATRINKGNFRKVRRQALVQQKQLIDTFNNQ